MAIKKDITYNLIEMLDKKMIESTTAAVYGTAIHACKDVPENGLVNKLLVQDLLLLESIARLIATSKLHPMITDPLAVVQTRAKHYKQLATPTARKAEAYNV